MHVELRPRHGLGYNGPPAGFTPKLPPSTGGGGRMPPTSAPLAPPGKALIIIFNLYNNDNY